jgi:hypothetical protein
MERGQVGDIGNGTPKHSLNILDLSSFITSDGITKKRLQEKNIQT